MNNKNIIEDIDDKWLQQAPKRKKTNEKKRSSLRLFSIASNIGLSMIIPLVGGALIGRFLDQKWSTSPKITITLIILGVLLGFYNMYRIIGEIEKENQ